jgi:hypothetical protein
MRLVILMAALAMSSAVHAQKLTKAQRKAIAMSPAEVSMLATVRNDPLDTTIQVTTEPFYVEKNGLLKVVNGDNFLRAFIDKKTGDTKYQLYIWLNYSGEWVFIDRLNYETPSGPEVATVHQVAREVLQCGRYGCTHQEHIAADIPEKVLRSVAADAAGGVDRRWNFRLFGRSTEGHNGAILKTEAAGLLLAVERVKATLPKSP